MRCSVKLVTAALLVGVVAGCAPGARSSSSPSSSSLPPAKPSIPTEWSTMPTPTGSPSPFKTPDQVAAEKVVAEYFKLKNQVLTDHSADLEPFAALLTGSLLEGQIPFIEEDRENNIIQQGEFTYVVKDSKVVSKGNVEVLACTDVTGTDVVDLDTGESVLDPDRSMHRSWRIDAVQVDGVWKVANYTTQAVESCAS